MIAVMSFTGEWGRNPGDYLRRSPRAATLQLSPARPLRQSIASRPNLYGPVRRAFAQFGLVLLSVTLCAAPDVGAQRYTRPERVWTTFETPHFRFHAPDELAPWARDVADRMESVRAAELRTVGTVPKGVTDVVVDDPLNSANGSAYPYLDGPAIFLWPVPPDPRSYIGNTRAWGELLAVHEFAHIAHLTRPSRNPTQRLLRLFIPGRVGPVATRTSRWVWEGYATYVEGVLTGSGRPHAALRAAVLRRWALDGSLPSYGALSGTGGYLGGSFAYLMGSAYLEWLGATRGDSSVTALWRRLSARVNRPLDAAFAGVYGDGPATLYNRFVADVTVAAAGARARLDSAGIVEGALVQRLARQTGDPAVRPDGRRLAVELANPDGPSRIVVWRAGIDAARDTAPDSAYARAARRLLKRDPEDVPAIRAYPLPRTPVATLLAVNGRSHHDPRWFADGRRILVWRSELTGEDVYRPDLFVWDTRTGALQRVTRGAAVQDADPSPDGRTAAGVRCLAGRCDLVRVDLSTGAVSIIAAGTFTRTWTRPRWSPDGRRLVAPVQDGARWRLALVDAVTGAYTFAVADDGAERYDATFDAGGRALVYTSERGGVPNVVRLALGPDGMPLGAEVPITRVTGAAFAAAADSGGTARGVYFLDLTPHGLDLRRVAPDSTPVRGGVVYLTAPAALLPRTPAAAVASAVAPSPPVAVDTFATGAVRAHAYGAGPRHYVGLPLGSQNVDGGTLGLQLASFDPAGRLTWLAQGVAGDPRPWHGASLRATWRGTRPALTGELFTAEQSLADRASLVGTGPEALALGARTRYTAAALFAGGSRPLARVLGGGRAPDLRLAARVGVVAGRLRQDEPFALGRPTVATGRSLALAEAGVSAGAERGERGVYGAIGAQGATGHTAGADWGRGLVSGSFGGYGQTYGLRLDGLVAAADRDAPAYERPAVGGFAPEFFDAGVVSQRLVVPALPTAYRTGREAAVTRLTLTGGAIEPYVSALTAGDRLASWTRLAGVEVRTATPFFPFARAPQSRLIAGVARIFDGPLRDRYRGYLSAVFAP